MFTPDQIKAAHAKVKSGTDFPNYIQDLITLGVLAYETFVSDRRTIYTGTNNYTITSPAKYISLVVDDKSNGEQFLSDLKAHQQGKTDYPTFCKDCAKWGVEKWVVDMSKMTCTYYDKSGKNLLSEIIPVSR